MKTTDIYVTLIWTREEGLICSPRKNSGLVQGRGKSPASRGNPGVQVQSSEPGIILFRLWAERFPGLVPGPRTGLNNIGLGVGLPHYSIRVWLLQSLALVIFIMSSGGYSYADRQWGHHRLTGLSLPPLHSGLSNTVTLTTTSSSTILLPFQLWTNFKTDIKEPAPCCSIVEIL